MWTCLAIVRGYFEMMERYTQALLDEWFVDATDTKTNQ